jgi:predicted DCC family thiol-disulfide oxidoreductase YuxK
MVIFLCDLIGESGVCNMCNGGVNFVLDNDPVGRLRFAALQSEAGRALLLRSGRAPDDISSLVLVEKDRFLLLWFYFIVG